MTVFAKIAFRNLCKQEKRAVLVGLTLVISCTLLLFSLAIGNGVSRQIVARYRDFQSGDVSVVWKNVKKIALTDPSRLFFSNFDIKQDRANKEAIKRLDRFLKNHSGEIANCFKSVRNEGMLDTGRYASFCIIFGVSAPEMQFWQKTKAFQLIAGKLPYGNKDGVCISDDLARKNKIRINDWITVDSATIRGPVNSLEYQVTGIYHSSSDFDSIYVYMTPQNALELFDEDPQYFRSARIYLKNSGHAAKFAGRLDKYLMAGNGQLRAETLHYSARFYESIAGFLKTLFATFVIFILFIIAIGIRSTVRLNLFERLKEFGALRAIGFNRKQIFLIVFLEILFLAGIALGVALIVSLILIGITGLTGLYIGKGTVAYALGGESVYPVFQWVDLFWTIAVIGLFSLFAPLKPGLRLGYQKITDLLAQNQKPVFATLTLVKQLLRIKSCQLKGEKHGSEATNQ